MQNEKWKRIRIILISYSMNFTIGALAMLLGSSLDQLLKFYDQPYDKVVLLVSIFALGRVLSGFVLGKLADRRNPLRVLAICGILIIIYLVLLPRINILYIGYALAFLCGIGFSGNDAITPLLLGYAFRERYTGALSIGQAIYAFGGFAISYLIGLATQNGIPFYYAYYVVVAVVVLMLVLILFTDYKPEKNAQGEDNLIHPLYSRNTILSYICLVMMTILYCYACNVICTYTPLYCIQTNLGETTGNFILSSFSLGSAIGAILFVPILNKVSEEIVLILNVALGSLAIGFALLIQTSTAFYLLYFIGGIFLGVLFSVLISLSTRIGYKHITIAASLIGIAGGLGDIIAPIITAELIKVIGIEKSYLTLISTMGLLLLFVILNFVLIRKKKNGETA